MKEPNSNESGWSYQDLLSIKEIERKIEEGEKFLNYEIFRRLFYVSYGLIQNQDYKDLPYAEEKEVYGIGEEIAYININKTGGGSSSIHSEIEKAYEKNEELLLRQIKEYNPNIIIFGGTLKYFDVEKLREIGWDLSNKKIVNQKTNNTHYYPISKDKLVVYPYHPSYFIVEREKYCSEIIEAGKLWREEFSK